MNYCRKPLFILVNNRIRRVITGYNRRSVLKKWLKPHNRETIIDPHYKVILVKIVKQAGTNSLLYESNTIHFSFTDIIKCNIIP
jgi:hypothetical protein